MKLPDWRGDLLLAGAILVFNLLFLGHTGLYDVDEAIFGEATREMVETGDFITPTYNYDVRWDKPPLIYWVMAGPLALFGPTSFGARFASACNGALLGLLLMAFGRAYLSPAAGRWAAVVLATCLHGFMLGHMSLTDMTLSLFMAASWMALFAASERGSVRWMLLAGVALGLGTLTKGPVAVVLPVAVWLLYSLLRRELLRTCDRTHIWWGVLLYCAVVAPWCWAIYERHGTAFFESFLGYHNLDRFSQQQSGHGGPVYTFVLVVLVGLTPWGGFMLSGLAAAARRWMDGAEGRAAAYLALWLGAVVGLFSLSQTKLPNYIAPCYPAAALLAGWAVARTLAAPVRRVGWIVGPSLLGLGVLSVVLATLGSWLPRLELLRRELPGAVITTGAGPL
ncbi:MAG: glycosyltransferase family 39 protein, partial [Armatimonadetes bacterium]|nr:glycosyltransferase family 39 protein [Armatimonadota bacterium]